MVSGRAAPQRCRKRVGLANSSGQAMDAKEKALVTRLRDRIAAREFGEADVLSLLIMLRQYASAGSSVRELGDFVAHRERDRGLLQRYIQHVCDFRDAYLAGKAATLHSAVIFDVPSLGASLADTLGRFGLQPLNKPQVCDLLACAMCILQAVQLYDGKQPIGRLVLARTEAELLLLGLVYVKQGSKRPIEFAVPALAVPNTYCAGPAGDTPDPFNSLVEASCVQGVLQLLH